MKMIAVTIPFTQSYEISVYESNSFNDQTLNFRK